MNSSKPIHRIYIQPATDTRTGLPKFGNSGRLYDAIYGGELVVWSSHQPFLDACRVLLADGVSGAAEMWDHIRPFPRMRSTIEAAEKLTVSDLPARLDRRMAAKIITRHFFPVSHRTLETWPIHWRLVNGKALAETEEILAFAAQKLANAVSLRG